MHPHGAPTSASASRERTTSSWRETDAKTQVTSFAYDVLDRLTGRSEPGLNSNWYYEANAAGAVCTTGIGKLCEATSDNPSYFRRYAYDSVGRLSNVTSHIDIDYVAQWSYDVAGRLSTQTFPASTGVAPFAVPLSTKYNYNANGILQSVTDNAAVTYWTRNAENADGNILTETYGNGLIGSRGYDPVMGTLISLQAGAGGAPSAVQNQSYHYDALGRLDQRQDNTAGVGTSETFGYDNLNRLTTSILTGPTGTQTDTIAYNAIGNITSKSGVGSYAYNASGAASVRPHAVSGVTGTVNGVTDPSYSYDNNGNMLTDGARSFSWTSFNMPAALTKTAQASSPGAGASTFLYGPEHQRLKQTWVDSAKTLTTYYLNEPHFEKEVNSQSGTTEYKHYITVGGRIVAIQTRTSTATEDIKYLIPDHLGSTSVVTDSSGAVLDRQAYDPWGDRRTASGSSAGVADPTNLIQPTSTDRGYTGHEHLDQGNMGLVHMNGRVYDPTLGRFISADPTVSRPFSSQGFARFAYVRNNPLNAVDPSGYLDLEGMAQAVKDFFSKLTQGFLDPSPPAPQVELPAVNVTGTRPKEEKEDKEKSSNASAGTLVGLSMRGSASGSGVAQAVARNPAAAAGVARAAANPLGAYVTFGAVGLYALKESQSLGGNPWGGFDLALQMGVAMSDESQAQEGLDAGANTTTADPDPNGDGDDKSKKGKSVNQINDDVKKGKAPDGIKRADTGKVTGEQDHVHFKNGNALNRDGTWKHVNSSEGLTRAQEKYLVNAGWTMPK